MSVTIRLTAELDRRSLTNAADLPRLATFAVLADGVTVKASDTDVPRDQDPRQHAAFIAARMGVPFDPPPLGVCFALRDDDTWWGYRIARGGGTGRGRTSRQTPIVYRQPATAVA